MTYTLLTAASETLADTRWVQLRNVVSEKGEMEKECKGNNTHTANVLNQPSP